MDYIRYELPSCNELIKGVQPRPDMARDAPFCSTCTSPHSNQVSHPGARCLACLEYSNPSRGSYANYPNIINEPSQIEVDYRPRRSSQTSIASSTYLPSSTNSTSGSFTQSTPHSELVIRTTEGPMYHPPIYTPHPPSPSPYPCNPSSTYTNYPSPTSFGPSGYAWIPTNARERIPGQPTKVAATNARHKDSEKKRRDINVSCVGVMEIFTRGIHPGVAAGCQVCIDDEDARQSLSSYDGLGGSDKKDTDTLNSKSRPKNETVEESTILWILYTLHHQPALYAQRIDDVVEKLDEQRKEQERGIKEAGKSETKLKKWQGDQRIMQTEKLLKQARELGRRHGILLEGDAPVKVKVERKRKNDEEHHKRHMSAPTPPSSCNSPRSRRTTPESGDESYVVVK